MRIIYQKLIANVGKCINRLIPKNRDYLYVQPHKNCKNDKYDLINCNADNSLKVIRYALDNYDGRFLKVFVEIYDKKRVGKLKKYIKSFGNKKLSFEFVESTWGREDGKSVDNAIRYIRNSFKRYRCKTWICDTGWARFWDKVSSQKIINFNYCTPFKKGSIQDHKLSFNNNDFICQTSLMCAKVVAAEYEVFMDRFAIIGFPRNDTLFASDKSKNVEKWLSLKGILGKKLIIYVPTYRPELVDYSNLNIFGLEDNGELDELLLKNNAAVITKLHPVQRKYLAKLPEGCILLDPTYDFSVYDLFAYGDVLVSDYSSISTDFLITGKPVVYLFSDIDKYDIERGFSFDPIHSVCCGEIDYTWNDLKTSINHALNSPNEYVLPFKDRMRMWHKYIDNQSTRRAYDLLLSVISDN